ncbi:MAG TPA: HAMP domain-containing sensor histidine kinase [Candidatus Paceibacterota bacterium]|nr:HAMP domain-containing sensor histidine kinase [Candidatus Paceibacterota bacterium]
MLKSKQLNSDYNLPVWLIPSLFFISIFYFCYEYIILKIKDDKLEDEIISIVNHAFRTPITSIIWHVKELEKNIPQNEKLLYLQNINNGANRILNVVDSLVGIKDVQNTSGYFFEAVSMREIIEDSINRHRGQINKKNIDFRIPTFKDIPLLTVDLKKISFVIDTLIENAIYYTKKDGKILIDSIYDFKKLVLFVSDTGIGLGMIDKLRIFSKFYRSEKAKLMNPDGMGLRLYISREIIKRHGGKIYAKSNGPDEGTTFFIEIPFKKK